jgi:ABC-2 type transport system ATP-binding protein
MARTTPLETSETDDVGAQPPSIVLNDVWVRFGKGPEPFVALSDLSLTVPKGKVFCLLGPNGSGKTTTINLISGLLTPSQGEVRVFGHVPAKERNEVLSRIAVVPQETALYESLTARENLRFHGRYYGVPADELPKRIEYVLGLVGLVDRSNDRAGTYSGGMQRRLTLARALLTRPQALLLDEPTLGVDVQSRRALWDCVRDLADSGVSILLTTNYMEEAEALADYITILDHGKKIVEGTTVELKSQLAAQSLMLRFRTTAAAQYAGEVISRVSRSVKLTAMVVEVGLSDAKDALQVINDVRSESLLREELESFEVAEPNLQDVFLQFTGRALRD